MPFQLQISVSARAQLRAVERAGGGKLKKMRKCLALLQTDPKHPGLNSHRYESLDSIHGQKVWESYVENKTPGAYRVFWHYGPKKDQITIIAITPHP